MALANVSPGSFGHLLYPDEMCLFVNLHSLAARLGKVQTKSYPTGGKKITFMCLLPAHTLPVCKSEHGR